MMERIRSVIGTELTKLGAGKVEFVVEWPAELAHGDFATNAAMAASKTLGKPPREIADALVLTLKDALGADATKVEVAGPGFVNITLSGSTVARELKAAIRAGEAWGRNDTQKGKRIIVEYSCPNPFKEMHVGHLMSTVIGEAVSRILENTGAHVIRDSYGGDIGPHVAKALWALQKTGVNDVAHASEVDAAYIHGSKAYEASEEARREIDTLNMQIYEGTDAGLMELWQKCREVCLEAFRELYRVLDTKFDYYFFESEVTPIGMRVVQDALAQGVFKESDGAVIYDGEKKGLHTLVFVTSRGTPTYEAKDIGLAFYKEERIENDEIIIETGAEQIGHFKVFLAALSEIAPLIAAKMSHISHGLMTLTTGKMSSRKGNVITAVSLLSEVVKRAEERNEDPIVAEQVAVAAVKYMILRQAAGGNIIFDPGKSLSLEGDSGPYLQYAYVRAMSILVNAGEAAEAIDVPNEVYDIARLITRFPEVVARAGRERAPHYITQYLTQLASEWNSFYAKERIIGGEHETYKLALVRAFANTMRNGLWLLGIPVPEKM